MRKHFGAAMLVLAGACFAADDDILASGSTVLTPEEVAAKVQSKQAMNTAAPVTQVPRRKGRVGEEDVPPVYVRETKEPIPPAPVVNTKPSNLLQTQAETSQGPSAEVGGGYRIEQVPREIKQKSRSSSPTLPGLAAGKSIKPLTIEVTPGVTEVVKVAKRYPTLIMTPFQNPQVVDGGKVELIYAGSNVYIKPKSGEPEALFISEKGKPSVVVSLMAVPEELPSQQISLVLQGYAGPGQGISEQREKKDDYVSELTEIMRKVGQGESPDGFSESRISDIEAIMGQIVAVPVSRFTGSDRDIFKYALTNKGDDPFTVNEASFYSKGVRAVALFPKIILGPGEQTFLFIMADKTRLAGKGN